MSAIIKHWITGHDSVAKRISSKPFTRTTRDALIVTALTLVTTILMTFIWSKITNTEQEYIMLGGMTILTTVASQYLYEYSGVNNMIAESSMRYARGSTLEKYVSSRSAMIYERYYKNKEAGVDMPRVNFDTLVLVMSKPEIAGWLTDYGNDSLSLADLTRKVSTTKDWRSIAPKVTSALTLPKNELQLMSSVSEETNIDVLDDMLRHGFGAYTTDFLGHLQVKE